MILLSLLGLAVRLWLGWWLGFLGDIQCWQLWGLDKGEYIRSPIDPTYIPLPKNYPPMYMCVVRLQRWVHRALDLPGDYTKPLEFRFHDDPDKWRPLTLYLKLPAILADIVTAWLLLAVGRRLGRDWLGVGVAAFYLFSPAILYDGAYFGQTDTILVMFLVAAVWAYLARRPMWFGAMLMAAPLMKAQAVFALPILGMLMLGQWRLWKAHWWRVAAGGVLTFGVVLALSWWTGNLGQFERGYFGLSAFYPMVTVRAFNFWWLLTRPWDKPPRMFDFPRDDSILFWVISYRTIAAAWFFAAIGLILWRLHRARYSAYAVALALAAAGWAFFNLPTQMHERYSVPAVGLMTLLLFWGRKWWWLTLLVSWTVTWNIAEVCPLVIPFSSTGIGFNRLIVTVVNEFIHGERHGTWVIFAVVHVLMLPLTLEALWREGRRPAAPTGAAPPAGGAFPTLPASTQPPS